MMTLIIGTPDSGKSEKAEAIAMELSKNNKKYYIATMIPFGKEGQERIKRHLKKRDGKGFITVEKPVRVHELTDTLKDLDKSTCLLECMSNLVGNEMYDASNDGKSEDELSFYVIDSVMSLSKQSENLVVVTNSFPLEDQGYDEDTKKYVRLIDRVNELLKEKADKIYELFEGEWRLRDYH